MLQFLAGSSVDRLDYARVRNLPESVGAGAIRSHPAGDEQPADGDTGGVVSSGRRHGPDLGPHIPDRVVTLDRRRHGVVSQSTPCNEPCRGDARTEPWFLIYVMFNFY